MSEAGHSVLSLPLSLRPSVIRGRSQELPPVAWSLESVEQGGAAQVPVESQRKNKPPGQDERGTELHGAASSSARDGSCEPRMLGH